MGWLSDAFGTVTNAVGDAGQWLGDTVGNSFQQTYNNLDDYWKAAVDLSENGMTTGIDVTRSALSDPTDINSYTDPLQEHLDRFNETGDELFGTGGWIKAGANTLSTGNPFYGAGSVGYQVDAAASGSDYDNGKTGGIANLVNLYNIGSNVADASGGTTPSSYQEATPDGGSITVTPSQYEPIYETGYNGTNITNPNQGDYKVPDNYYMNPDIGTLGTGTYGTGAPTDMGQIGYGSYGVPSGDASSTVPYTPGIMDQARDFLNSGYGKVIRAGAGFVNPTLGTILNGASEGLNASNTGDLAKTAINTLGGLYLNNRAQRAYKNYQDQINSQLGTLQSMYSSNSPYAQQLRQELERKDAAAGRRSQYGNREVQLQAALADKQAGVAPMSNLLTSNAMQTAIAQQQAARSRQFNTIASMFDQKKTGPNTGAPSAAQQGWDAIKSVWSNL